MNEILERLSRFCDNCIKNNNQYMRAYENTDHSDDAMMLFIKGKNNAYTTMYRLLTQAQEGLKNDNGR